MDDLDYEERDYGEMVLAEAEESAEIIEMGKMLDERIDEVTEQSYAKGKASAQAELDEALSIINRFANFDIYNERADALHMVAVRFLDKHEYIGE